MSQPDLWPEEELQHLGRCPVCQGTDRTLVHRGLVDRLFHCSEDRWNLYACAACRTHYLDPRPSPASIGRAYAVYLTHGARPNRAGPQSAADSVGERVKRILRALANGYRNARWGMRLEPSLPPGRFLVPCLPLLRGALVQQMHWLPRTAAEGSRLLDVGCGNGEFLELARLAGWSVEGTDFDAMAVATARSRGLDVHRGGLEVLQGMASDSFDWVSVSHVLEHVHEPMAWFAELHRIVRPGGTLWLQTPNVDSLGHARYGEHWRGLEPPRHLTLWTWDTLRKILGQAGFREVRRTRTSVITGMELCANSEALQRGMDHAAFMALTRRQQLRLKHVWPALRQHWSMRRGEFLTVAATK